MNQYFVGQQPLRYLNIVEYGADPNGIQPSDSSIQHAVNDAGDTPGSIVFTPPGTFRITKTIVCKQDNVNFVGSGFSGIWLADGTLGFGPMLQVQGPGGATNFRYGIRISDMFFNGNNVVGCQGVDLISTYGAIIENTRFRYLLGINLYLDGISASFGAYNFIEKCYFSDGGTTGVGIQSNFSEWFTIMNCFFGYFSGGTAKAIWNQNFNDKIIGCSFDHNDTAIQCGPGGDKSIIAGNQYSRGMTRYMYMNSSNNCMISNNLLGTRLGGSEIILLDANSGGNVIEGNSCPDTTWPLFINEASGITGVNQYYGNDVGAIPSTIRTGVMRNNRGYNPIGPQTPPAIPASGVAFTNPFPADCTVFVNGGTVSAVAIGGTATGQISGMFRIPFGQTIKLTYTVAPTWTWFGD